MRTSFQHKFLASVNEALTWKEVPEEEKQKAHDMVKRHNAQIDKSIPGYYAIDVTGKYSVYYTFWRVMPPNPKLPPSIWNHGGYVYMGNLSTELLPAIDKATAAKQNVRLELVQDVTKHHVVGQKDKFTFGKYRGEAYPEVYFKDPSYFIFLNKNADPKYAHTNSAQAIQYFAQLAIAEVTKKNQETSKSQYVGNPGDIWTGRLKVYNIKAYQQQPFHQGYGSSLGKAGPKEVFYYSLTCDKGNKFKAKHLEKVFPNIKKDDVIAVKAKIKENKEIMGIKFNMLTNVKPLNSAPEAPSASVQETPPNELPF